MVALLKTLQVILALSLLIFIHELGHFAWAKAFRIKVEKFYLFFDIGGKALWRHRKGETEFGIGWLPLGGYCKISGMIDESMDLKQMKQEPQPWEFRTHPAWQRLLVMAGGVLNNFIFAILAYILILNIWGSAFIPNEGNSIWVNDVAFEMGFRNGDRILAFDDYVPTDFGMLQADLARKDVQYAKVLRGTDTLNLYIDHAMMGKVLNSPFMFDLAVPFVVDTSYGGNAGLAHGDKVVAIDGTPLQFVQEAHSLLDTLRGQVAVAGIVRGTDTLAVPVQVDTAGRIGVQLEMPEVKRQEYSFLQAVPAGWKLTWSTVGGYLSDLKLLAQPRTEAYKSVGSFISIGQVFPATWDWYQFLQILALLSIMLAVMNLIPIPGLDGGHILFTLWEMITGRKPSDRFLAVMQVLGLALIMMLMVLAFGNDIGKLIH